MFQSFDIAITGGTAINMKTDDVYGSYVKFLDITTSVSQLALRRTGTTTWYYLDKDSSMSTTSFTNTSILYIYSESGSKSSYLGGLEFQFPFVTFSDRFATYEVFALEIDSNKVYKINSGIACDSSSSSCTDNFQISFNQLQGKLNMVDGCYDVTFQRSSTSNTYNNRIGVDIPSVPLSPGTLTENKITKSDDYSRHYDIPVTTSIPDVLSVGTKINEFMTILSQDSCLDVSFTAATTNYQVAVNSSCSEPGVYSVTFQCFGQQVVYTFNYVKTVGLRLNATLKTYDETTAIDKVYKKDCHGFYLPKLYMSLRLRTGTAPGEVISYGDAFNDINAGLFSTLVSGESCSFSAAEFVMSGTQVTGIASSGTKADAAIQVNCLDFSSNSLAVAIYDNLCSTACGILTPLSFHFSLPTRTVDGEIYFRGQILTETAAVTIM